MADATIPFIAAMGLAPLTLGMFSTSSSVPKILNGLILLGIATIAVPGTVTCASKNDGDMASGLGKAFGCLFGLMAVGAMAADYGLYKAGQYISNSAVT